MSSKTGASAGSTTGEDDSGERLHIRAIKELPSDQDDEIAAIFREMRHASELSLEQLSAKLNAPVTTLQALETGAIRALPDWTETSRIVSSYAGLMGLDSRPVLRRIKAQLQARGGKTAPPPEPPAAPQAPPTPAPAAPGARQPTPAPGAPKTGGRVVPPAGPPMPPGAMPPPRAPVPPAAAAPEQSSQQPPPSAPAGSRQKRSKKPAKRARSIWGTLVTWLIVLILFVAMGAGVHYAAQNPSRVWSVVNALPDPAPRVIRSAWELVRPIENNGPASPGVDPKGQKSDKVPGDQPSRAN